MLFAGIWFLLCADIDQANAFSTQRYGWTLVDGLLDFDEMHPQNDEVDWQFSFTSNFDDHPEEVYEQNINYFYIFYFLFVEIVKCFLQLFCKAVL